MYLSYHISVLVTSLNKYYRNSYNTKITKNNYYSKSIFRFLFLSCLLKDFNLVFWDTFIELVDNIFSKTLFLFDDAPINEYKVCRVPNVFLTNDDCFERSTSRPGLRSIVPIGCKKFGAPN